MQSQAIDSTPLVTVVICVYNAGDCLRSSVESILDQTYRHLEILIIDDGSTDGCMESIADLDDPRIRIITQENQGKSRALNRAMTELEGEFMTIHDADDLSHPRRIELQVKALLENPELAAVLSGHELIIDGVAMAPTFAPRSIEHCRLAIEQFEPPAHDPTVTFRTSLVRDFRYDPVLELCEGHDFIMQVGERYAMQVLGECLYSYRIHANSITSRTDSRKAYFQNEMMRRACLRRNLPAPDPVPRDDPTLKGSKPASQVGHFTASVVHLRQSGRWWKAMQTALQCIRFQPTVLRHYRPFVYMLAPKFLVEYNRRRKKRWTGRASRDMQCVPRSLTEYARVPV